MLQIKYNFIVPTLKFYRFPKYKQFHPFHTAICHGVNSRSLFHSSIYSTSVILTRVTTPHNSMTFLEAKLCDTVNSSSLFRFITLRQKRCVNTMEEEGMMRVFVPTLSVAI